jgi:hypothetical protein
LTWMMPSSESRPFKTATTGVATENE